MQKVGNIKKDLVKIVGFEKTGDVYLSNGTINHIIKRHKEELSNEIVKDLVKTIKSVLSKPDLIGKHPKKEKSIEFVKKIDDNILVAIKTDLVDDYLYVSTMYPIKEAKIKRRIHSGRLKKV